MIVNCLEINEQFQLKPFPPEKAVAAAKQGEAVIWLDLGDCQSEEELDKWLKEIDVSALSRHLLKSPHDRSGFYPLQNELLFVTPFLPHTSGSNEIVYVSFLCMQNLLLTLHRQSVFKMQHAGLLSESMTWLPDRSIAGLISAIMISMTLRTLKRTTKLRNTITRIEEKMESDPDTVEIEEIMDLRSDLLISETLACDSLPTLTPLSALNKPFFKLIDAQEYLGCALGNMQAVDGALTLLRARIRALHSGFDSNVQNRTNRRLNILTVLSAIFLPITLLAGIWGMNFEKMPELGFPFGYPMALGLMVLIALGMLFLFRKDGWFD